MAIYRLLQRMCEMEEVGFVDTGSVSEGWTPPDELWCCSAWRRVFEGNE